jgi:hypothetical protein
MEHQTDGEPASSGDRTRWNVRRRGATAGDYESASGRRYLVGDRINLPPPAPHGSIWRVVAVEPAGTEGFDGTLLLEPDDASEHVEGAS